MPQRLLKKLTSLIPASLLPRVFVVSLQQGKSHLLKGKVPPSFLADLDDFAKATGVQKGVVSAVRQHGRLRLVFSKDIAPQWHQRLRNIWQLYARR